jgi:hypothetical protein
VAPLRGVGSQALAKVARSYYPVMGETGEKVVKALADAGIKVGIEQAGRLGSALINRLRSRLADDPARPHGPGAPSTPFPPGCWRRATGSGGSSGRLMLRPSEYGRPGSGSTRHSSHTAVPESRRLSPAACRLQPGLQILNNDAQICW